MKKLLLLSACIGLYVHANAQMAYSQNQKIVASDRNSNDRFGYAVTNSGDYAAVGAYAEDENEVGASFMSSAGSVYIYEKDVSGSFIQMQKIVAPDRAANDFFGWSVSMSGDYLVVGAYQEDEDASFANTMSGAGSAYIFERDGGGTWNFVQKIVASDRAAGDAFGYAVSVSGDYLVVGAYGESQDEFGGNTMAQSGSAYVFERDGGGIWNEVQKLVASDRAVGDLLGTSVSISGDYLVLTARDEDEDASGSNTLNAAGSAYVFERDGGGVWNQVQKIVASDRAADDIFGCYAAISGDYIMVGAFQEDEDETGSNTLTSSGSVYIFERDGGGSWNQVQKIVSLDRAATDNFGWCISIDGDVGVIGAYREDEDASGSNFQSAAGSAYVFKRDGSGTWYQMQKIVASDRIADDYFGAAVTISGNTIMSGAYREDEDEAGANFLSSAGSVYSFEFCMTTSSFSVVQCESYTVPSGDETYTISGVYNDTIPNAAGCDSVITITATILPASASTINPIACVSYTVPSGDETYTMTGTYMDTIPNALGCDSVITINLTIGNNAGTDNVSACGSYTVPSGDETYTVSGIYNDTIPNIFGCDSVLTLTVTILPNSTNTISASACASYTVPSGDETYSFSGVYMDTIPNFLGCDSILTINLSINNSANTLNETACISYTVPSGDETYTMTGTYMDTIPNFLGCDSILTINLTIQSNNNSITEFACGSYTVPSGDETYTMSGVYNDTIPNMFGCDSVLTINLTIGQASTSSISETACGSYTVPSGDETYSTSGIYNDTIPNLAGCDSVITINLTINTVNIGVSQNANELTADASGAAYQWIDCNNGNADIPGETGQTYIATSNGDYAVIVTENGCTDTSACYNVNGIGLAESDGLALVLYPNPGSGIIHLQANQNLNNSVQVLNAVGAMVYSENITGQNTILDLTNLESGVYYLHYTESGNSGTIRFVIQR